MLKDDIAYSFQIKSFVSVAECKQISLASHVKIAVKGNATMSTYF